MIEICHHRSKWLNPLNFQSFKVPIIRKILSFFKNHSKNQIHQYLKNIYLVLHKKKFEVIQISIKIPNLQLCCWLLLGYVFAHCVNGSGGGKYCGDLNKLANRDSNVSPEWWWLPLSPLLPLFPFPLLFGRSEFLRVGGVGGLLPEDNDWWGLLDNIWLG